MKKAILTAVTLILSFSPMLQAESSEQPEEAELDRLKEAYFETLPFSESTLIRYLHFKDAKSIEIVLKQAKLESGHFKSDLFKQCNNLFGMNLPKVRRTTAIGFRMGDVGKRYQKAMYKNWKQSVDDYLILVNEYHANKDKTDYYSFLVEIGFCELGSEYINLLKTIE